MQDVNYHSQDLTECKDITIETRYKGHNHEILALLLTGMMQRMVNMMIMVMSCFLVNEVYKRNSKGCGSASMSGKRNLYRHFMTSSRIIINISIVSSSVRSWRWNFFIKPSSLYTLKQRHIFLMMMTKEEEDVGGMVWVWQRTVMEINEPELTESVWRLCMRELNEFHVGFFF